MKKILILLFLVSLVFCNEKQSIVKDAHGDTLSIHRFAAITIDYPHEKIHDGYTYRVCTINYAVANNGTLDFYVKPGQELHFTGAMVAEGKAYAFLYRNPTITGGTTANIINMRDINPVTCNNCLVKINPSISDTGIELTSEFLTGGTGPQSIGSSIRSGSEWNLDSNNSYLLRLKNVSGQAKDLNINIQWYEDTGMVH